MATTPRSSAGSAFRADGAQLRRDPGRTIELGQGTGPLRGVKVVEIAGIGPGPHACMILADLGADVIRVERPGRAAARRRRHDAAQPRPAQRRARPQAAGGRGHGPRAGQGRRRAGRGHASRGDRAARDRPGALPGGQPAAGLRADDRLGPARPAGPGRGPRHELHLGRRRAVRHGPDAGSAAVPGQPGRRLRRRIDVPRHRAARRSPRGPQLGPGTGRGRRDRRRHRAPQRDDVGDRSRAAATRSGGLRTCSTAGCRSTTSTRPPTASTSRSGRWSRSSSRP